MCITFHYTKLTDYAINHVSTLCIICCSVVNTDLVKKMYVKLSFIKNTPIHGYKIMESKTLLFLTLAVKVANVKRSLVNLKFAAK